MRPESIQELMLMQGVPYRISHIPLAGPNRPAVTRPGEVPTRLCVHGSGNRKPGASARMHEGYVRAPNWGGPDTTSYHCVLDDLEVIELLPWEEIAYHGGTATSNTYWWAVEICENDGHYGARTLTHAAKLLAAVSVKFGKSVREWVLQHNAAYGKDCPRILRQTPGAWAALLQAADGYAFDLRRRLAGLPPEPAPEPPPGTPPGMRWFPETRHAMGHGFLARWTATGGLQTYGFPLTEEEDGAAWGLPGYTVQITERARFEYNRASGAITLGLVGAELLRAQGRPFASAPVASVFRAFYDSHGGIAQFGLPLLRAGVERTEGHETLVQWCERARLELAQNGAVQLGRLGAELLATRVANHPLQPSAAPAA